MPEITRTMSPDLTAKVEAFNEAKAAHAAAEQAFKEANDASSRAGSVRRTAAEALAKAKTEMQTAFLQDVDPMPLVPATRPGDGLTITIKNPFADMATFFDHRKIA